MVHSNQASQILNLETPMDMLKDISSSSSKFFPLESLNPKKADFFAVLFFLLLTAMTIRQSTVLTESKQITANAAIQNKLNDRNAKITFAMLPPNAKTATINAVQDENERYAALREDIQNSLITARQNAEVMMTQASTNVNLLQQNSSEDSGWLETLNTIYKVLVQMTQNGG